MKGGTIKMDKKILTKGTDILNDIFFGRQVFIGDKPVSQITSPYLVRNAIKYISLDQRYRDIWDDPNMLQAHKYQNIPQVDISTFSGDYCIPHVARYVEDDNLINVRYVYVSAKVTDVCETFTTVPVGSALFNRFAAISNLNNILAYLEQYPDKPITVNKLLPIFGAKDKVNMFTESDPAYGITVEQLYQVSKESLVNIYVSFRRGWSRLLEIRRIDDTNHAHILLRAKDDDSQRVVHLLDTSAITTWDGTSTRIENHGVEVEDMVVDRIRQFPSIHMMRTFRGTHEQMQTVILEPDDQRQSQYYTIQTLKGINVDGFEFNMP